jgi:hypothetical protein
MSRDENQSIGQSAMLAGKSVDQDLDVGCIAMSHLRAN